MQSSVNEASTGERQTSEDVSHPFAWGDALDALTDRARVEAAALISQLPRGGSAIIQTTVGISDRSIAAYRERFYLEDVPAWQALETGRPVQVDESTSNASSHLTRWVSEWLEPNGFQHAAAAPVGDLLFSGYPCVIEVFRTAEQGSFSDDDLKELADACTLVGRSASRLPGAPDHDRLKGRAADARRALLPGARRWLARRFFVFDRAAHPVIGAKVFAQMDEMLRRRMSEITRDRIEAIIAANSPAPGNGSVGRLTLGEREAVADSIGDLWMFRVTDYPQVPALGDGPFVVFCLQPECEDWGGLHASDLSSDLELARLLPAVKFMQENYQRGPALGEIAATVSLSPFHFHRTFTEVMGITPKHLLLDCQIEHAKHELLSRERTLVEIARDCGFAHQSHFTSRFKQASGLTPTRWRKVALSK